MSPWALEKSVFEQRVTHQVKIGLFEPSVNILAILLHRTLMVSICSDTSLCLRTCPVKVAQQVLSREISVLHDSTSAGQCSSTL